MAASKPLSYESMLRSLECSVCHEHFRSPKTLPCGHTVCLSPCLEQISDGKTKVRCPECRAEHVPPEGGVKNFPTNVSIARFFETPKPKEEFNGCPLCGEMEELVKCLHCELLVCCDCRHNHTSKFKDQVTKLLETLQEETTHYVTNTCDEQGSYGEALVKEKADRVIEEISATAQRLHSAIDVKKEELTDAVEEFAQRKRKTIRQCKEEAQRNMQGVVDFCDTSINDLTKKVSSQVRIANVMSNYVEKKQFVAASTNKIYSLALQDINVNLNEQSVMNSINNLGHVFISERKEDDLDETNESTNDKETEELEGTSSSEPQSLLDRDTSLKLSIGTEGSGDNNLCYPYGLTVDPVTKDILVVDHGNHRIQVFDRNGNPVRRFGSKGSDQNKFNGPRDIALTADRKVIISDTENNRVKVYTYEGVYVSSFGSKGTGPDELDCPRGIAIDKKGNIHVCDGGNKCIKVFDKEGKSQFKYDTWKAVKDEQPYFIAINITGSIAVTLHSNIAILNDRYQLINIFPGDMYGICWIDNGNILLPDRSKHCLRVHEVSGDTVKEFGQSGHYVGQLMDPRGVFVDDEGFVYVSSFGNHMVQKF